MLPSQLGAHVLLTAVLLVPAALATGATSACSKASTASANPNNAASGESPGAAEADMKKVILNVFGMT